MAGVAHLARAAGGARPRRGAAWAPGLLAAFAGTFALTLSNPATILSFIAVFGALAGQGAPVSPWLMVAGVLLGSALWWLLLTAGWAGCGQVSMRGPVRVNRTSALLLAGLRCGNGPWWWPRADQASWRT